MNRDSLMPPALPAQATSACTPGRQVSTWHSRPQLVFLTLLLALGLAACGYKDSPVAPQEIVPKAVSDLTYVYDDNGVTLSWSYPTETITGKDLSEILEFQLYRAVVPVEEYCENCPLPYAAPIPLIGGVLPPERAKTMQYQATVLRPGNLYFFKVRSKTSWWAESKDSNTISFLWQSPPEAPQEFTVSAGDEQNILEWQPVRRHRDSSPVTTPVSYQIYRSVEGSRFEPLGKPINETSHVDEGLENGRNYSYRVQALQSYPQGTVGSVISKTVSALTVDHTPPPLPTDVHAVRTDDGVKIFWEHGYAPDLAAYRVYRRAASEHSARLVGTVNMPYNLLVDSEVPAQGPLFYSVSSIDTQNPPNESQRTAEVRVDY